MVDAIARSEHESAIFSKGPMRWSRVLSPHRRSNQSGSWPNLIVAVCFFKQIFAVVVIVVVVVFLLLFYKKLGKWSPIKIFYKNKLNQNKLTPRRFGLWWNTTEN